jgi:hypothetical protein
MRRDPACKAPFHHLPMHVSFPDHRVLTLNDGKGARKGAGERLI